MLCKTAEGVRGRVEGMLGCESNSGMQFGCAGPKSNLVCARLGALKVPLNMAPQTSPSTSDESGHEELKEYQSENYLGGVEVK